MSKHPVPFCVNRPFRWIAWAAACVAAAAVPCLRVTADTIHTRDGEVLRGQVLSETDRSLRIRTRYGDLTVQRSDIKQHDRHNYEVVRHSGSNLVGRILGETNDLLTVECDGFRHEVALTNVVRVTDKGKPAAPSRPRPPSPTELAAQHQKALGLLQKKEYRQALDIYERLLAGDPDDMLALYNAACAHALSGNPSEAVALLKRSVEAGFVDFGHIERDSDFTSLRGDAGYKALLAARDEHVRRATDKAVARISEYLAKQKIKADAYRTLFDPERNFVYLHAKSDEELAKVRRGMEDLAEWQWRNLFQNKPGSPVYIVLLTAEDSPKLLGRAVGGVYNGAANALFCGDAPAYRLLRTSVVLHEFTHALHHADQNVRRQDHPIWIVEGLATLFESADQTDTDLRPRHNHRLAVVQAAVRSGVSRPWTTIVKLSQPAFLQNGQLHYAQSRYMLFYMWEKGLLKRFYDEYTGPAGYQGDRTAAESFEVVFGKPLSEIERDWREWILLQKAPAIPYLGVSTEMKSGKLVITQVAQDSPAAKCGVAVGDAIRAFGHAEVKTQTDLLDAIAGSEVGDDVEVVLDRAGKEVRVTATLIQRPGDLAATRPPSESVNLGVAVAETNGVLTVKEVVAGSPADKAGIAVGAQLLEFDGKKLASVRDYLQILKKCKAGQTVRLKVRRGEAPPAEIPVTLSETGEARP